MSMMSAPQERVNTQMSSVPYTVYVAPQPNTNPIQWNVQPVPAQPYGYPAPPMWDASPGQSQMIYPTVQPAPPGYNVPGLFMPQVTGLPQCQQVFLQGKPKSLGIVLIVTAILQFILAISLPFITFTITLFSGVPFWGAIFYIIAGSLSIAAQKKINVCLIRCSFAFHIISSLSSIIGLIINGIDFAILKDSCYQHDGPYECNTTSAGYAIVSILFMMNLLAFCVSISASVYGRRAVEQIQTNIYQVFVVQREFVTSVPPSNSSVPQAPPPYVVQEDENTKPAQ